MAALALSQLLGRSAVHRRRDLPGRRVREYDVVLAGEGAADLDAEVDFHRRPAPHWVVVDEDVVAVGSKALVPAQEGPDLV